MEELFGILLEVVGEILIQLAGEITFDVLLRAEDHLFKNARYWRTYINIVTFTGAGVLAGLVSLAIFPHPLFPPTRFHGISLLLSPVATGLVMMGAERSLRRLEHPTSKLESFSYGFLFAFCIAAIRFFFAG